MQMYEDRFGYRPEIPVEFRKIFMWLSQDVASLHQKWNFYLVLFTEENIGLLDEMSRGAFKIIEEVTRNDMTMEICRLSDPSKSRGKQNISFKTLIEYCTDIEGIDDLVNDFIGKCMPVRELRNKRVGHSDFNTRLLPNANPLAGIGRAQIDQILALASNTINQISYHYNGPEFNFQSKQIGGADKLISLLREAKEYQKKKFFYPH